MEKKFVYIFDDGLGKDDKVTLGYKGAMMAELTMLGFPIPAGFIISGEACLDYEANNECISNQAIEQIEEAVKLLEKKVGKYLGNEDSPLLISIRASSRMSMPGTIDSILNLGLNDKTVVSLERLTKNKKFAYDSYRRFIQMFSITVMGIPKYNFDEVLDEIKSRRHIKYAMELNDDDMQELTIKYKQIYKEHTGKDFPQDIKEQLYIVIKSAYNHYNNPRAIVYRKMHNIPSNWGVALTIQEMVFGNIGGNSGTGIAFTRNPITGEKGIFGEYLLNAQGEEIMAGFRMPTPVYMMKNDLGEVYSQLEKYVDKLERHFKDMQDIEFTIENNKLFILQTKTANRTAQAALKIAVDLVEEGLISERQALLKIEPKMLENILYPSLNPLKTSDISPIAKGMPASPGAVSGKVYFSTQSAKEAYKAGESVVLVLDENIVISDDDIKAVKGILTSKGSCLSYIASLARKYKKSCICGCVELQFGLDKTTAEINEKVFREGDYISIDGSTGNVYDCILEIMEIEMTETFIKFMSWADKERKLQIKANADNLNDIKVALDLGVDGFGLFRTEYNFIEGEIVNNFRKIMLYDDEELKNEAMTNLFNYQKDLFVKIYSKIKEKPLTVRLMDPQLNEIFIKDSICSLADELNVDSEQLCEKIEKINYSYDALEYRGCRLSVIYPELIELQIRPMIEAVLQIRKEQDVNIVPEIVIPFVTDKREFSFIKNTIVKIIEGMLKDTNEKLLYKIGVLIETPRSVMIADELAKEAEFFSFGTSDLTFMAYGIFRESANDLVECYEKRGLYSFNPFERIDEIGVGNLIETAIKKGKSIRAKIGLGVCGLHSSDPESIKYFSDIGITYLSCTPYKIPIAKLAAAQAAICRELCDI